MFTNMLLISPGQQCTKDTTASSRWTVCYSRLLTWVKGIVVCSRQDHCQLKHHVAALAAGAPRAQALRLPNQPAQVPAVTLQGLR
jgi:hypothetical protein